LIAEGNGFTMTKRNKHIGSSLDAFLSDEGISKQGLISKSKEPEALKTAGKEPQRRGADALTSGHQLVNSARKARKK
jgi:hypothetical protein